MGQEKRDWLSNVAEQNTVGKAIGYGKVKDNRNSITHSGINTRNLVITDDAGQQKATGMSAAQTAARLYTDINTDTAEAASGSLKNQFDKEAVQKELDRQREVTQEFDRTRQQVKQTIHGMVDDKRKKAESIRYGNIIDGKRGYNNKESLALDASADKWEKTAFYTDLALGAIYGIGNSNAMIYTGTAAAADPARRAITAPMQIWEVKCRQDGLYCSNRSYDGKKLRPTDGQKMAEIGEKRQIFDLNEIRPGEKSGVITVSNNGIFNPRDDALKNAVKQNGSHARSDGIYVVYNRPTGNPFSELLYAAYDKTNDLLGGRLPLSNAERANVLLYDYAKRNNYKVDLSNHSRGGMTASVALQYANRHGLTEIPIREARFYGSATHVQRYADNLQKNGYSYEENGKTYGSATYAATHHTDFVGRTPLLLLRSKYIVGGNKPTGGVEGKWFLYSHSSYFWDRPKERLIDEQGRFIDADGNLSDKPVDNPYLSRYKRIWEKGETHNQASPNASAPILVRPTKKIKGIEYYETPH